MDVVYYSWLETPVDVDTDLQLPHFSLEEAILYDCSQNYTAGHLTQRSLSSSDVLSDIRNSCPTVVSNVRNVLNFRGKTHILTFFILRAFFRFTGFGTCYYNQYNRTIKPLYYFMCTRRQQHPEMYDTVAK